MKRFRLPAAVLVFGASFALATAAFANAPLIAFGDDGTVTIDGNSATIHLDASGGEFGIEYGGVSVRAQALGNKAIGNVAASFWSTGDVAGGAPRLNIPIDNDGDRMWDYWAVLDAANCGGTSDVPVLVSTTNPDCQVYFLGAEAPASMYADWSAYAAGNPTHRVASKGDNSTPFIIADGTPGDYAIEAIDLQ
jgi:hypothetical protein